MVESVRQTWIDKVTEIAHRVAERESLELWTVEAAGSGRGRVVRIFIDKPGGVSHADCELISEQVSAILDVENVVPGDSYQLEVSSPGVERKLRHEQDFRRFAGQKARIALREAVSGQRRFEGIIHSVGDDGMIVIDTGKPDPLQFRMDQVDKANLKFEW